MRERLDMMIMFCLSSQRGGKGGAGMIENKEISKPLKPSTVKKMLKRLVNYGCGCPAWCHCLLCRVRRVAQTESGRYRSEWPLHAKSVTTKTKMLDWRGGYIEFSNGGNNTNVAQPPWYVIQITGEVWGNKPWYQWLDYGGPPQVYLTRKAASAEAKAIRKQYRHCLGKKGKVIVIKITL